MALIKCTECSKEVSDKAVSCPHCGAPIASNYAKEPPKRVITSEDKVLTRNRGCADIIIFGPILLIVLLIIIGIFGK